MTELEIGQIDFQNQQVQAVAEYSHYSTLNDEQEAPQLEEPTPQHIGKESEFSQEILTFDHLIHDIGFGWYQVWMFVMLTTFGMTEGSQITIFTLSVPILQNEWGVSSELTSLQASFVFIGFLIGAFSSGQFTDRIGRKLPFIVSAFLTTFICLISALCQDIYQLLALRGMLGIVVGFFAPCSVTMLQEITPAHLRGRFMSVVTISVALGQLYGLLVASLVLDSLTSGNWRLMTFWCTLPGAIAWFASLLIVEESPRFLLIKGQHAEAFTILARMNAKNGGHVDLTKDIEVKLRNWATSVNLSFRNNKPASVKALFRDGKLRLTTVIWSSWFFICFTYYGNLLMLPYVLTHMPNGNMFLGSDPIAQLVISCFSDIAGGIVGSTFVEVKGFGRKNSLIIFLAAAGFSSALVFLDQDRFLLWCTAQKFFLSMSFIFLYQLTSEVYPTQLRATGLGTAIAIGRLGGIMMPWTSMALAQESLLSPFLVFAVMSLISSVCNTLLPFETMGKEMDG